MTGQTVNSISFTMDVTPNTRVEYTHTAVAGPAATCDATVVPDPGHGNRMDFSPAGAGTTRTGTVGGLDAGTSYCFHFLALFGAVNAEFLVATTAAAPMVTITSAEWNDDETGIVIEWDFTNFDASLSYALGICSGAGCNPGAVGARAVEGFGAGGAATSTRMYTNLLTDGAGAPAAGAVNRYIIYSNTPNDFEDSNIFTVQPPGTTAEPEPQPNPPPEMPSEDGGGMDMSGEDDSGGDAMTGDGDDSGGGDNTAATTAEDAVLPQILRHQHRGIYNGIFRRIQQRQQQDGKWK